MTDATAPRPIGRVLDRDALDALAAGITTGPWRWGGLTSGHAYLSTVDRGRTYVLDALVRSDYDDLEDHRCEGLRLQDPEHHYMRDAREYAVKEAEYRDDIATLDHPDARLIAAAPDLLATCVALMDGSHPAQIDTAVLCDGVDVTLLLGCEGCGDMPEGPFLRIMGGSQCSAPGDIVELCRECAANHEGLSRYFASDEVSA